MQAKATPSKAAQPPNRHKLPVSKQIHPGATYHKVLDGRKRPIRGLWQRGARFYARLAVEDLNTGRKEVRRVPLEGVQSVAQAQAAMRRLQTQREENNLPVLKRTPKFSECVKQYLAFYETVKDAKRPKTIQTERGHLNAWVAHLGESRVDRITPAMINAFIAKRQGAGLNARTVNLGA